MEPIQKHLILIYRFVKWIHFCNKQLTAHVPYREDEDVVDTRREEISSTLTTDGVMYSYPLANLNPGSFELTVTPISVVGDNTVKGPESARKRFEFTVGEWPYLHVSCYHEFLFKHKQFHNL